MTVPDSEVVVIAPDGDSDEALVFARQCGARMATASGPTGVVEALGSLLQ